MEIRFVRPEEKAELKEMWSYCFGDGDPFLSWFFDTLYLPENTLAVCENGRPVSSLQMFPYFLDFRSRPLPVTNIYGVFTMPEARNRGIMSRLIPEALREMKQRGSAIAILLPVNYEFYRKYGWETCYYHLEYRLTMDNLQPLAMEYGYLQRISPAEYLDDLNEVYLQYSHSRSGYLLRTPEHWTNLLQDHVFDGGSMYILKNGEGRTEGYILYSLSNGTLTIREMGYKGRAAAGGLWNFVLNHAAQAHTVLWKAPFDDITYRQLKDARETVQLKPFLMSRVIDVQKILELLLKSCKGDISVRIAVEDLQAPWNHGIFNLHSGADITREEMKSGEYDVKCSIHTMTGLSMGSMTARQADLLGKLEYRDSSVLERLHQLFEPQSSYINDYF